MTRASDLSIIRRVLDIYRRDSIGVRYVQCVEVSNYDRQRAYGSPNRRDDSGWGEREGRRHKPRLHTQFWRVNV